MYISVSVLEVKVLLNLSHLSVTRYLVMLSSCLSFAIFTHKIENENCFFVEVRCTTEKLFCWISGFIWVQVGSWVVSHGTNYTSILLQRLRDQVSTVKQQQLYKWYSCYFCLFSFALFIF